jgi:molybdopterin converting factor small subunit
VTQVRKRYWAAAKDAAGVESESVDAANLAEALSEVRTRHDSRFVRVLGMSSLLVDGVAVGSHDPEAVLLDEGATVEVLPPFAGG